VAEYEIAVLHPEQVVPVTQGTARPEDVGLIEVVLTGTSLRSCLGAGRGRNQSSRCRGDHRGAHQDYSDPAARKLRITCLMFMISIAWALSGEREDFGGSSFDATKHANR
jgi:hypothetical protein